MEEKSLPFEKIVFVCCHQRDSGERVCCADRGGVALRDALKARVRERGLRLRIRVSQSGCMDRCEDGANVMIFPDNLWLSGVTEADVDPLLDRLASDLKNRDSNQL